MKQKKGKRFRLVFLFPILSIVLLVFVIGFVFFQNATRGEGLDIISSFLGNSTAIKETDGWTNILLLGRGGILNDTPDLTDTIIVAQIRKDNPRIVLLSIPRDIWVAGESVKINHLYLLGKEKSQGEAFAKVEEAVTEITGLPIHYAAVIDYSGFEGIIDALNGVDVTIENSFTDYKYPIIGKENDNCNGDKSFACRYETVTFLKGVTHMNGQSALKFVRSRHSLDPVEGSDLGRAARQQKVIDAIKQKLTAPETLTSYKTLIAVRDVALSSVQTDISISEASSLAHMLLNARDQIVSSVIGDNFIYSPPISRKYGGQFVFLPKRGNWDEVKSWVNELRGS